MIAAAVSASLTVYSVSFHAEFFRHPLVKPQFHSLARFLGCSAYHPPYPHRRAFFAVEVVVSCAIRLYQRWPRLYRRWSAYFQAIAIKEAIRALV